MPSDLAGKKFGRLTPLSSIEGKKIWLCACECGKQTQVPAYRLLSGHTRSCGCLISISASKHPQELVGMKFGRLTVLSAAGKSADYSKNWLCQCNCGTEIIVRAQSLYHGLTKSCGCLKKEPKACRKDIFGQKFGKLTATRHIGFVKGKSRWLCRCDCGKEMEFSSGDLTQGLVRSCGCLVPGTGDKSDIHELFNCVQRLAPDAVREAPLCEIVGGETKMRLDIYVPSKKLAIEYHGLRWHTENKRGKSDYLKFLACAGRIRLVQIYSDEWKKRKSVMLSYLCSLLGENKGKRVVPEYKASESTSAEARSFLNKFHYLGASSGFTVLARHPSTGEIIGCWVFSKRSDVTALWRRACWNHDYRAWNPHEKALLLAVSALRKKGIKKILTFSDNRFHVGKLYEAMGFEFEKSIRPNYYYTDGNRRLSKYALRVSAGTDEKKAAMTRGWHRIWDSGKRRYSLLLEAA